MSLTVTESIAVGTLLDWLLDQADHRMTGKPPTEDEAREAAQQLAAAAYKRLSAGRTPEEIARHWPGRAAR